MDCQQCGVCEYPTTIRIKQSTKERLDAIGNNEQSCDDIINLVCNFFEDRMIYHLDD